MHPATLKGAAAPLLERADTRILLEVYRMNRHSSEIGMPIDTPYLFAGRRHKRARALVARGYLKEHDVKLSPQLPDVLAVTITQAGIDAYNAQKAGEQERPA